jgi:thiol:disulfide interchange protein DsbC
MKIMLSLTALLLAAALTPAQADDAAIKDAFAKSMPKLKIDAIKPSEIKGVSEISVGNNIYYVSDDGKYLLQGHLIDVAERTDLTELRLSTARNSALDKLGEDKMIIFKPKISKYKVTVFTDIDCGYCRKLHSEIDSYFAQGITIRYVFFPRAGKDSESYKKAVAVWCAKDRNEALTAAKKDQKLDMKTCENPVDEHMRLGEEFDVKGTPMIITEKGNVFPGYLPAKELYEVLETESKHK